MADLTVTAARIAPVNETQYVAKTFIAASTITAGQPVYLNTSGKIAPAKADDAATSASIVGLSLNGGAAGDAVEVMIKGSVYGVTLSGNPGTLVYVSKDNAGGLTATAPSTTGQTVVAIGCVDVMTDASLTKVLWVDVPRSRVITALA